ncbi:MAG: hypothetical protein AAF573_15905, partial [Bacteroidota bacterium]
ANHNQTLTEYQAMSEVRGWHGTQIGFRYRLNPVAITASWQPLFQTSDFRGKAANGSTVTRENFYRMQTYSAGLELFIKNFSFGGSFGRTGIRIRTETSERSDRYIMYEDVGWSSQFFLSFNSYDGDALSVSFQPYVHVPWTDFNFKDVEEELGTDAGITNFEDRFWTYGFRIVFQNGRYEN